MFILPPPPRHRFHVLYMLIGSPGGAFLVCEPFVSSKDVRLLCQLYPKEKGEVGDDDWLLVLREYEMGREWKIRFIRLRGSRLRSKAAVCKSSATCTFSFRVLWYQLQKGARRHLVFSMKYFFLLENCFSLYTSMKSHTILPAPPLINIWIIFDCSYSLLNFTVYVPISWLYIMLGTAFIC